MTISKLILIFFCAISFSTIAQIEHPNLSGSTQAIQERQKELLGHFNKLSKHDSAYIRSESYGKLGQFYHIHDFLDVGIKFYTKALELAPTNSKWHYLKALAYRNKGEFNEVIQSFLQAWKYNDQYSPTMIHLAEIYSQQGQLQDAKNSYKKVLNLNKNSAIALSGMGQILMQEGKADEAIESYIQALTIQPYASQVNFLLSQAYAATGNAEKAKEYNSKKGAVKAQFEDPLSLELYEESRSSSYYNDKAVRSYLAKQYETARLWAERAISYEPESPYPKVTLANVYVSTGQVQKAVELMKTIVVDKVTDPNLIYSLGVIEEILGNNQASIKWYKEVLKLDPNHQRANVTLSNALMRQADFGQAMVQLKKARELDQLNPHITHRMASIHAYNNECALAKEEIYNTVKAQPKNFAFLITLVKIAVHCDGDQQFLKDALNAARNMYQITQRIYLVEHLAMIEAKNGNFDEAVDYQAQAIFQLLNNKDSASKKKISELKNNLKLYKSKNLPASVFTKNDIDLNPESFKSVK